MAFLEVKRLLFIISGSIMLSLSSIYYFPLFFSYLHCLFSLEMETHLKARGLVWFFQVEFGDGVGVSAAASIILGSSAVWVPWGGESEIMIMSISGYWSCSIPIAASLFKELFRWLREFSIWL